MSPSRAGLLLLAASAIPAFFILGLDQYLDLDAIKRERMRLVSMWHDAPVVTAAIFIALHATALALSLPGAVLSFTLASGAIFGPWWGTAIALTAIVLGDSLAFLGARFCSATGSNVLSRGRRSAAIAALPATAPSTSWHCA